MWMDFEQKLKLRVKDEGDVIRFKLSGKVPKAEAAEFLASMLGCEPEEVSE